MKIRFKNYPAFMAITACLAFSALLIPAEIHAQIGIGTTNPHQSAMLHITTGPGNNRGVILPGISSSALEVLDSNQNIANGLIMFDEDLQKHYYFNSSPKLWMELDHDWVREDVHGASALIGQNLTLGVAGNLGIGTTNADAKMSVAGNVEIGSLNWVDGNTAPANSLIVEDWVGIGRSSKSSGTVALDVVGDIRSSTRIYGKGTVPPFGIIMYNGSLANFPGGVGTGEYAGWYLCNGGNGTPNLQGRFVVGSGSGYSVGGTGGAETVTLSAAQMPLHNHTATTSTDGDHRHGFDDDVRAVASTTASLNYSAGSTTVTGTSRTSNYHSPGSGYMNYAGDHDHTVTVDPAGGGAAHENRPPYYVVAYIQYRP
jgi:microcystin-dependent protein